MSGDRTKLPKWAQQEFKRLESNIDSLERQKREMMGESDEPTEVFVWEGLEMIGLPARSVIRFGDAHQHFDVHIHKGNLRIHGSTWYIIHPQASNAIDIEIRDR